MSASAAKQIHPTPLSPKVDGSGDGQGPAAWLARSLSSPTNKTSSPTIPFASRSAILPLPNPSQRGTTESKTDLSNSISSSQPSLKFLNRRKKGSNNLSDTASETAVPNEAESIINNVAANSIYANLATNPIANAKAIATTSEKLHKLSIEIHNIKEERDQLLQDKNIWLKKIKDDNVKLTLMLQDIRSVKSRVLSKIEKYGLGDDGNDDIVVKTFNDNESDTGSKVRPPREADLSLKIDQEVKYVSPTPMPVPSVVPTGGIPIPPISQVTIQGIPSINLDDIKGRSIQEQWEDEFQELDETLREILWEMLLSHVTTFLRGHPLSQGLEPTVIREIVQEISFQVRSLVGKAVTGLLTSGTIVLPIIDDDGANNQRPLNSLSSTRVNVQKIVTKLLHSSAVHSEIAGEVTMTLTYLYALDPRPLPAPVPVLSQEISQPLDIKPAPSATKAKTEFVPLVKPVILEPKQFQRPPSPSVNSISKPKRNLVIETAAVIESHEPQVETLLQPKSGTTTPSPRYMQPLNPPRTRTISPSASASKSGSVDKAVITGARPSSTKSSTSTIGSQKRVLNIDDDGVRASEDNIQTLRQVSTASPKAVPRYMQPKSASKSATK